MVPKCALDAEGDTDPNSGCTSSTSGDGKAAIFVHPLAISDPKSHAEGVKGEAKQAQEEPSSPSEDVPPVPFFKLFR